MHDQRLRLYGIASYFATAPSCGLADFGLNCYIVILTTLKEQRKYFMPSKLACCMLSAVALFIPATDAYAWVGCPGKVKQVEVRVDGSINADWGYGWRTMCYLNQTVNRPNGTVTKEACGAWYAALISASATRQDITTYHSNSTSCNAALAQVDGQWMSEQPYSIAITGLGQ